MIGICEVRCFCRKVACFGGGNRQQVKNKDLLKKYFKILKYIAIRRRRGLQNNGI